MWTCGISWKAAAPSARKRFTPSQRRPQRRNARERRCATVDVSTEIFVEVVEQSSVLSGHDQDMPWCHGLVVHEGDDVLVFVDSTGRQVTPHELT
jgi:hypothetical protein